MNASTLELLKAWYLFSFSIGFYTCFNLALFRKGDKKINLTLLIFVGLLLIPTLNAYIQNVASTPIRWLSSISQNLTWAYGPLLLLVVKHTFLQTSPPKWVAAHFAPFAVVNTLGLLGIEILLHRPYFHQVLYAQTSLYCSYACFLVVSNRPQLFAILKNHANTTYYWLLFLAVSLLGLCIFDFIVIHLITRGNIMDMRWIAAIAGLVSLYVSTITLFSLYQPNLFFTYRSAPTDNKDMEQSKPRIRNIELTKEAAQELNTQLNTLTKTHNLHLDETMSLAKLASLLGVTRNQLSELFNVHNSTSFYEFLNDLRYKESLRLLDCKHTQHSIGDIAFRAGFNNRNSFYNVFKERTSMTPSKKELIKGASKVINFK